MKLQGKTAIITGSSDGIGLAIASLLSSNGAAVILNGRNKEKLLQAQSTLNSECRSLVVEGDVSLEKTRANIVKQTLENFGKIDFLINNAGGGTADQFIEQISEELFRQILETNLVSTFGMCKEVAPFMKENRSGKIINIASVAGRDKSILAGPHYTAAKAGIIGFTKHLAKELAPFKINVNSISPGVVMTDRIMNRWRMKSDDERNSILGSIPLGRFASPEEIAHAVLYLVSDEASYITGISLDINGGLYMN